MSRKKKTVHHKNLKEELPDLMNEIRNPPSENNNETFNESQINRNEIDGFNEQNNEETLDQIIQKINNRVRIDERRLQRATKKRIKYATLVALESTNLSDLQKDIQKKEDYYCEFIDKRKLEIKKLAKRIQELEDQESSLISNFVENSGNDISSFGLSCCHNYPGFSIELNPEEEEEAQFSLPPAPILKRNVIPPPPQVDDSVTKQLIALTHLKSQLEKSIQELTLEQTEKSS